jgi:hypothetical protein
VQARSELQRGREFHGAVGYRRQQWEWRVPRAVGEREGRGAKGGTLGFVLGAAQTLWSRRGRRRPYQQPAGGGDTLECDTQAANINPTTGAWAVRQSWVVAVRPPYFSRCGAGRVLGLDGNEPHFPLAGTQAQQPRHCLGEANRLQTGAFSKGGALHQNSRANYTLTTFISKIVTKAAYESSTIKAAPLLRTCCFY